MGGRGGGASLGLPSPVPFLPSSSSALPRCSPDPPGSPQPPSGPAEPLGGDPEPPARAPLTALRRMPPCVFAAILGAAASAGPGAGRRRGAPSARTSGGSEPGRSRAGAGRGGRWAPPRAPPEARGRAGAPSLIFFSVFIYIFSLFQGRAVPNGSCPSFQTCPSRPCVKCPFLTLPPFFLRVKTTNFVRP